MALHDLTVFEEAKINLLNGSWDLSSDSWSLILITTQPNANQATPDSADFTEVTQGGGYTTGGIALTSTLTEAGGTATFDFTTNPSWTAAAGSPTNIVCGLIVNTTHAGTNDALGFVEVTTDGGTTPVSLVAGDIDVNWHASGVFTLA